MQWSDVTKAPSSKTLRQFAGLCLLLFGSAAVWRLTHGQYGAKTIVVSILGFGVGLVGLVAPLAIRYVYTGWMMLAFPIGWVVSKVVMAVIFYGLFTPISFVFGAVRRDVLQRRRRSVGSYWAPKTGPGDVDEYFRQY